MDLGLENKIALVSGATAGLGFAAAQALLAEGARVVICGRDDERLQTAVKALDSERVLGLRADVTNSAEIVHLLDQAVAWQGGLDILITNAGGPPGGPL